MYANLLKRRLQDEGDKESPFSSTRYLAERMSEDMLEKARITPKKKPRLVQKSPEEVRRPKRPRPYVDPWARELNLEYGKFFFSVPPN